VSPSPAGRAALAAGQQLLKSSLSIIQHKPPDHGPSPKLFSQVIHGVLGFGGRSGPEIGFRRIAKAGRRL
jgi:hypothetical protein